MFWGRVKKYFIIGDVIMFDQVDNCISNFFDIEEVIVQPYLSLPYGRKVIDHTGDYMVISAAYLKRRSSE